MATFSWLSSLDDCSPLPIAQHNITPVSGLFFILIGCPICFSESVVLKNVRKKGVRGCL